MRAFISAALPWVLAGTAIAVICAGLGRRETPEKDGKLERRIALGMSLGLLFGVALNGCGLWEDHSLGLAIGSLWGMALATLCRDGDTPKDEESGPGED